MKRKIKFEAYRIITYVIKDNKKKEIPFDFLKWIQKVNSIPADKRICPYYQEKCSVDKPGYEDGLWYLNFNRLRDVNLPTKKKADGESRDVELDDDEYIGESALMIYDPIVSPKSNIIIMQRNIHSLGISGIVHYLNNMWAFQDNLKFELAPIIDIGAKEKLTAKKTYKKLDIRLGNVEKKSSIASSHATFNKVFDLMNDYSGMTAQISIGMGRCKNSYLDKEAVDATIDMVEENRDIVKKAQIAYEGDDGKTEIVDLLDNKTSCAS